MSKDDIPIKTICFELLADALLITRTDGKQIGIGLKDISEITSEQEKYFALMGLFNFVTNEMDELVLKYVKDFHKKLTGKSGLAPVNMKIPKKRRH